MFDNNENMNNDFFKETIIDSEKEVFEENDAKQNMEEFTSEPEISEPHSVKSLIFSRDIDFDNPYIKETFLGKLKQKKKSFWRYTAAVVCGMFAGALIFGGAFSYAVHTQNGRFMLRQYSAGQGQNGITVADTADALTPPGGKELNVTQIAEKVGPAVVGILSKQSVNTWFGVTEQQGSGSGIIISHDGYIITNSHVIEGATSFKVVLASPRS